MVPRPSCCYRAPRVSYLLLPFTDRTRHSTGVALGYSGERRSFLPFLPTQPCATFAVHTARHSGSCLDVWTSRQFQPCPVWRVYDWLTMWFNGLFAPLPHALSCAHYRTATLLAQHCDAICRDLRGSPPPPGSPTTLLPPTFFAADNCTRRCVYGWTFASTYAACYGSDA